ncbi:Relaxase/Mobilisation nuclease domain-containing protein [Mucilaginibacter sp. OK268]|uniref:relaxase/mobilization nuclease domain-containing protein n=1 Tax=Mucilaginibacter sp. OK268 TaxID=1881048 RepID=UPI00088C9A29|nr:relaxase/mobilization nuclease domain-containing protein [Mucilaginibacter sp. OK268]SDP46546.1 Relaxase/Mobilisation nuclease domain-containing protein [Mucilaginibacter sp. OK268]
MIVKIFDPIATFGGVSYNTRKIDRNKGELMKTANFGPLQAFGHLKPRDYINYLSALSALNKNVKLPQFHAVISAKGKIYDKTALTQIAESWLKEMGYGDQPYLIVYHKDTGNNHVHMVSTRVDRDGKKISSAFEYVRAQKSISRVLGYDVAMQYRFSTRAQFFMILESMNYPGIDPDDDKIREQISRHVPDKQRAAAIASLLRQHKNAPALADLMKERFRIDLLFHSAEGKKPYGYSIIDHDTKQVFKGSEVLPLKDLLNTAPDVFRTGSSAEERADDFVPEPSVHIQSISIADDVDDQQIHGMRRKRQRKARTNTR